MEDAARKRCARCEEMKPLSGFNRARTGRCGRHNHCRDCQRIVRREWYLRNREHSLTYAQNYVQANEGKVSASRKTYHARCRDRMNAYRRNRIKVDPNYRMRANLRRRIASALSGVAKTAHTLSLLGCSIDELRTHIQRQFEPGMSWDNYGYWGWHIDHITPCCRFDLTDPEQQKQCFHYSNLRPLWRKDNVSRGWAESRVTMRLQKAQQPTRGVTVLARPAPSSKVA
jgi:hypothetical protein